jgi:hypothetical protein
MAPTTRTMPSNESIKKQTFFVTPNRYSAPVGTEDDDDEQSDIISQECSDTTTYTPTKVPFPPPIFIEGVSTYTDLLSEFKKLIDPIIFICKSTSTHLKVHFEKTDD